MRQSFRYVSTRSAVEMLGDPCHTRGFIHRYYGTFGEEVPRVVQRCGLRRELEHDEMLLVLTGSLFRLLSYADRVPFFANVIVVPCCFRGRGQHSR